MATKILVVAPHADDEVLGCGGMISRRVSEGAEVHVVVGAIGGVHHRHLAKAASVEQRRAELEAAAAILGVTELTVLYEGMDQRMDTIPQVELTSKLDACLDRGYEQVFFPYESYNEDHHAIFRATYAALRPTAGRIPPSLVALYEYQFVGWNAAAIPGGAMYVDITEQLDQKIAAFEAYESQIRPYPSIASSEAVRTFAKMRGLECGRDAAELFYLQRLVV